MGLYKRQSKKSAYGEQARQVSIVNKQARVDRQLAVKDYAGAIADSKTLSRRDPKNQKSNAALSDCLKKILLDAHEAIKIEKDYTKASALYRLLIKHFPDEPKPVQGLIYCHIARGDYAAAWQMQEVFWVSKDEQQAQLHLSHSQYLKKQWLQHNPGCDDTIVNVIKSAEVAFCEAKEACQEFLQILPPVQSDLLSVVSARAKANEDAEKRAKLAELMVIVKSYHNQRELAAISLYEKILVIDPSDMHMRFFYAQALKRQDRYTDALKQFQAVLTTNKNDYKVLVHILEIHLKISDTEEIKTHLVQAKKVMHRCQDVPQLWWDRLDRVEQQLPEAKTENTSPNPKKAEKRARAKDTVEQPTPLKRTSLIAKFVQLGLYPPEEMPSVPEVHMTDVRPSFS